MDENRYMEDEQLNNEDINLEEEVPEVKMSVKKTMFVLVGFMVFVICVLLFVRSCSVARKSGRPISQDKPQVESQVNDGVPISNMGSSNGNNTEKSVNSNMSDSSLDTGSNSVEKSNEVENAVSVKEPEKEEPMNNVSSDPKKVNEFEEQINPDVQLSDKVDSNGLISSKKVYKFNGSFIYGVEIIVLAGDSEELTCQYFCPYKTYSSVNVGDTVKVSYQKDADGVVSIYSIG